MAVKNKTIISFRPKQVVKDLLSVLSDRAQSIVVQRYGLGKSPKRATLEGIGKKYDITRERVRQIENHSLANIRNSEQYKKHEEAFVELKELIRKMGGIIAEEDLLESISTSASVQNHVHFLLVVGEYFFREKEDEHFKHRWHIDQEIADKIHTSLKNVYEGLSDSDLLSEPDLLKRFLEELKDVSEEYRQEEIARRWLSLSKTIAKNPLGEWGRAHSSNVNARGIRDYAFLIMRKHGSPIHFKEIAKAIEQVFKRKAHVATTHNELIKDPRFVLVGRGLYALNEWGYSGGVVRDVIKRILKEHGPLTKKEIIEKVLKERYVKENTIVVNLQNPEHFRKDKKGRYSIAE